MKAHSDRKYSIITFKVEFGLIEAASLQVASLVLLLISTLGGEVKLEHVCVCAALSVASLAYGTVKGLSAWLALGPVLAVGYLLIGQPMFDLFVWVLLAAFVMTGHRFDEKEN